MDPLVNETGASYTYTGDDPVNGTDPSGLLTFPSWLPGGGVVTKIQNGITRGIQNAANNTCNALASGVWWPGCVTTPSPCNNASVSGSTTVWNTDGLPSLKTLHPRSTIEADPSFSYWSQQSTDSIVRSLSPSSDEPLTANWDGVVMDGNTRITILQDRGYDVDLLPRDVLDVIPGIGGGGEPPDLIGE